MRKLLFFLFWCVFVIVSFNLVPFVHNMYVRGNVVPYPFLPHIDMIFFLQVAKHSLTADIYNPLYEYSYSPLALKIYPWLPKSIQYYYSPLSALILFPFSLLSLPMATLIWRVLMNAMLLRIVFVLMRMCGMRITDFKIYLVFGLSVIILSHALINSIAGGEMSLLLLWMSLEALLLMRRDRHKSAAALLSLAVNIKFLSLPFFCYAAYRGYWKVLLWGVVFSLLYLLLPALFYGFELNMRHHLRWSEVIGGHPLPANFIEEMFWFAPDHIAIKRLIEISRQFSSISLRLIILFSWIITLLLIGLTLYFLRRVPLFHPVSSHSFLPEISYLFLIIPLIYPHQNLYSYLFTLPALIYVLSVFYDLCKAKARLPLFVLLCLLSFILCVFVYASPFVKVIYEYFFDSISVSTNRKGNTVWVLLLIPLLAWCYNHSYAGSSQRRLS